MPKPSQGDYHSANVQRGSRKGIAAEVYFAKCKCGWQGADRMSFDSAADDALAHDETEND